LVAFDKSDNTSGVAVNSNVGSVEEGELTHREGERVESPSLTPSEGYWKASILYELAVKYMSSEKA
jgi:hypothetical protein